MSFCNRLLAIAVLVLATSQAHAGWQLTFSDEFEGVGLDTTKWNYNDFFNLLTDPFAGDQQCYSPANVTVDGGVLSLTATNQVPLRCVPNNGTLSYLSGQVTTANRFFQTYGYFEIRAKLAAGVGLNSVFRLPYQGGSFPPQPRDIYVGDLNGSNPLQIDLHYDYLNAVEEFATYSSSYSNSDYSLDFHRFGVDWQPGLLIWYVDGVERARFTNPDITGLPAYLMMHVAVGNTRVGSPTPLTFFPSTMSVDYVRVYQRVADGQPDTLPPSVVEPDSQAPAVVLTRPRDGVSREQTEAFIARATATDNVAVTKVEFTMAGELICTDTVAPYRCRMTAPKLNRGERSRLVTIVATAYDAANNSATSSATIKVTR